MRKARNSVARLLGVVWEFFLEIALGIVVLWGFFVVMGGLAIDDPLWLTIAMGVLAAMAIFHIVHMRRVVEHDTELSRRAHRLREMRGF